MTMNLLRQIASSPTSISLPGVLTSTVETSTRPSLQSPPPGVSCLQASRVRGEAKGRAVPDVLPVPWASVLSLEKASTRQGIFGQVSDTKFGSTL